MKPAFTHLPFKPNRITARHLATLLLSGCVAGLSSATVLGQTDDFNDGNDADWTHIDLGDAGLPPALYTFPDDGNGGKAYHVYVTPPPVDAAGPARAMIYRAPKYSRFEVAVDFLAWDATVDQAVGLLARLDALGLGVTSGYTMNYNTLDQNVQINEIAGEAPTTIAENAAALKPSVSNPIRFVFSGYEGNLLGQVFQMPDTNNPLVSVVATDTGHTSGNAGLLVFSRSDADQYTAASSIADATFDNYSAGVAGNLNAVAVELSPRPQATVSTIPSPIKIAILNRETQVVGSSITLTVDGTAVPASQINLADGVISGDNADPFPGVTATYTPSGSATAGAHTVRATFSDNAGNQHTNEWTFTYATLSAANANPSATGVAPGFNVRLVQAPVDGPALANSLARAELQLATNAPASLVAFTTNVISSVINYSQKDTNSDGYVAEGNFGPDLNFPGINPVDQSDPNDLAMEIHAYLQLAAGAYTFGVISDDGFQLRSGATFADTSATVLGECLSGTYNGTFDFTAPVAGLYPFRLVWFERGGGAHVELFNVDRTSGTKTLINAADCPVKAFTAITGPSVSLESSATVSGFAAESGATIDTSAKTITIPVNGDQRFYRLKAANALHLTSITVQNGAVVLHYE